MKIIKPGVIPEKFWWLGKQFSCNRCKCVFELEAGDIVSNVSIFRYNCPTCKATLSLKRPVESNVNKKASVELFEEVVGKNLFAELFEKPYGKCPTTCLHCSTNDFNLE